MIFAGDDGYRRVGGNLGLKGGHVVSFDNVADAVAFCGDEFAQCAAVVVEHPAVSADVRADAAGFELQQGGLIERDVDVRPTAHGAEAVPIHRRLAGRNLFQPDVGRIANHEVRNRETQRRFEEIADLDPLAGQYHGSGGGDIERDKRQTDNLHRALRRFRVDLKRLDRPAGLAQRNAMALTRLDQASHERGAHIPPDAAPSSLR